MSDVEITWELVREWPLCSDCDERIEDFFTSDSSSTKQRVKFEYGDFVEACEFTECTLCQAILEACDQLLAGNWAGSQKFISIDIVSSTMLKVFWGATVFISIRKGKLSVSQTRNLICDFKSHGSGLTCFKSNLKNRRTSPRRTALTGGLT